MITLMSKKLILASASPRRSELLKQLGVAFTTSPAEIDETLRGDESPSAHAGRLAMEKAAAAAKDHREGFILGADTIVVLREKVYGKPSSREEAAEMLSALSGKEHCVITAFAIIEVDGGRLIRRTIESRVRFREISDAEIEEYLETDEYADKAGAYAVQGQGARFVEKIEGSRTNVIGLPMDEVGEIFISLGLLSPLGT